MLVCRNIHSRLAKISTSAVHISEIFAHCEQGEVKTTGGDDLRMSSDVHRLGMTNSSVRLSVGRQHLACYFDTTSHVRKRSYVI